jgi:transposase
MLLGLIDTLTGQIDALTGRIDALIAAIPAAAGTAGHDDAGSDAGPSTPRHANAIARLDEIPGISPLGAQIILAEIGLDMSRFPTANHLVSWAKLCPRTIQSGATNRAGKAGKGNPYLKGVLGEAATAAAKTNTFLGERYRRIVKRRGKLKALVAVARSILVIVWHLLANPAQHFTDLGSDYHLTRIDKGRKIRNLIAQLEALGQTVVLQPAA